MWPLHKFVFIIYWYSMLIFYINKCIDLPLTDIVGNACKFGDFFFWINDKMQKTQHSNTRIFMRIREHTDRQTDQATDRQKDKPNS